MLGFKIIRKSEYEQMKLINRNLLEANDRMFFLAQAVIKKNARFIDKQGRLRNSDGTYARMKNEFKG